MAEIKNKKPVPVKWIAAGIVAAVLVAVLLLLVPGKQSDKEKIPAVHSADEAIDLLKSKGKDLGYENALSELTELRTDTVEGDSYYRLQQNYKGIPVYGRTVVYAADENGEQLSVTQNIQDISGGLNPNPTAMLEDIQYYLLKYLAEEYPDSAWADAYSNEDLSVLPEIHPDPETLCVYTLDGSARLAYEMCLDGLGVLIDAHTGEVLHTYRMIRSATASFAFSHETLEVPRLPGGEYVLKDEENGIYIYSAQGKTYWNPYTEKMDFSVLKLVTSQNSQFGEKVTAFNRDDNVDSESMVRAKEALYCVRDIHNYFSSLMHGPQFEKMVLVYDDKISFENGENAGGWYPAAKYALGGPLFDSSDPEEPVASIILGTYYSADVRKYIDVVAHEYTHFVTRKYIGWTDSNEPNTALNEAFSDIFGTLVQASVNGEEPDWQVSGRTIYDPYEKKLPAKIGDTYPSNQDYAHGVSTIISHTAYKMWCGLPEVQGSSLSMEELAQLWYRTMLMMPADADFEDCRYVVEVAADVIGLTDAQKRCISQAFDDAGIRDLTNDPVADFRVQEVFTTDVWDADNTRCTDCEVTVRKSGGSFGPMLYMNTPIHWNSSDSERFHLKLSPGVYTLTVTVHGEPEATETYDILVTSDSSAEKEISIYMNQGKSMLDIEVYRNIGGKEDPLPGATVEIYRDNPNQLVYLGGVNETGAKRRFYLAPDKYTVVVTAWGYAPAQVILDMHDTAVHYEHTFLMEPTADDPAEGLPEAPTEITGGVPYEIVTWEKSHTGQTDGVTWTNRYSYDYVILQGDDPAYEAINSDLYSLASEKMTQIREDSLTTPNYGYDGLETRYEKNWNSQVVHNGNGIISILISPNQAVTYSLYNGAPLGLHILAGDDADAYLKKMHHAVFESDLWHAYVQDVSTLTLDDFAFVVMDGEIVILGVGSPGRTTYTPFAQMIHTGLYVSTDYTERLKGTLRGIGGTASADYEYKVWDRSFSRGGAPGCLQFMRYTCDYPVLSGTPACGQINQEIYSLAEQFMTGIPDSLTRTSNRFEFYVECNPYSKDGNVSYNHSNYSGVLYHKNGILSYVMNWKVQLGHYRDGQKYIGTERYDGLYGIVYDLETGAHLTLQQITGMDERTQLLMLKDAYARTYNNYFFATRQMDYDPKAFSVSDPMFFIAKDGEIILHYSVAEEFEPEYLEDLPKTAHTFAVTLPTGLYVLDP